jgi:PucR family transcriptional regulator, purine catabolism regulatory protein
MTTFTVNDALQISRLREAQVRAGAAGLTRPVTSVNVMEVPDILPWVRPHELLLTTLYPLRDVPNSLGTFVEELARRDLAGIVVKTKRYFDTIPEEMCIAADRVGLPLIELLHCEVSFDEIITDLLGQILSAQTQRLQHSEEVHRRFTAIVLAGGGLQDIAVNLALLLGNPVAIVAPDRRVLALGAPDEVAMTALNSCVRTEVGQRYVDLDTSVGQPHGDSTVIVLRRGPCIEAKYVTCFACPIRVGTYSYGSIIMLGAGRPFDDDDAVAMEHAATVSALVIMKDRAIVAVERKFQSDFLDDLLAGRITSMDVVASRSLTLGWNPARPHVVCVAQACSDQEPSSSHLPHDVGTLLLEILESARAAAHHIDPEAIVVEKNGQFVFILGTTRSSEQATATLKPRFNSDIDMGQQLLRDLRFLQRERQFILGIGRQYDNPLHLHRSYQEARQAVAVGSQLQGAGAVIHYNDLGFQRILFQFENRTELRAFADELLGRLEEYDRRHNTDLLLTLETVLNSNLNMAEAAAHLHLHYNSLRYRLQKIEDLTGPFMDDALQRMNLELALQIRKILPE